MQVIHGLATVAAGADDGAISVVQALGSRDLGRCPEQVAEKCLVFGSGVGQRGDVFAGNDQDVGRRFGIDVEEGIALIILINGGRWDGAVGDAAKEAVHTGNSVQECGKELSMADVMRGDLRAGCRKRAKALGNGRVQRDGKLDIHVEPVNS